ncbi:hypothetical protein [Cellulosimicrobium sp. NPDC057127]|uniref:hypothetical protein n=1 Tax=Cellulosimicrobium sp. NPDC057127 TaxID=3346026 RepID=UPI0036324493
MRIRRRNTVPLSPNLIEAVRALDVRPRERRWSSVTYCVLDAVWSIGISYDRHVVPAVRRVAAAAGDVEPVVSVMTLPASDPLPLSAFRDTYRTPDELVAVTTAHRTSSRSRVLKAETALRYADVLVEAGVDTLPDAAKALEDFARVDEISARLRQIPGDGVRTGYFWMLVGDDDTLKLDRMILRFLKRHGTETGVAGAKDVLRALAAELTGTSNYRVTPWMVDHAIWNAERARR